MTTFQRGQVYLLKNEGFWNNVRGDGGGETYRGIARNFFPSWKGWPIVDKNKPLKYNQRIESDELDELVDDFYRWTFWKKIFGDEIINSNLAIFLYDFYVNAGGNAVKCLQRVLGTTIDGILGNNTLHLINTSTLDLLSLLHNERNAYYKKVVDNNPNDLKFYDGWINRSDSLYKALTEQQA